MSSPDPFRPVTHESPCVICRKGDWCRRSASGGHECHRINEPAVNGYVRVATTPSGFAVYRGRDEQKDRRAPAVPATSKPARTFESPEAAARNFAERKHGTVETLYCWTADWHRARIQLAERKIFCEITRVANGWALQAPPKPRSLYRIAEIPPDGVVGVGEGEKACEAAWSIGLACVTSGAADSAGSADWTPLSGREVVLFPDNDDVGRKYSERVASILLALPTPARVRIVELPGRPNPGDDFVEYLASRDSRDPDEIVAEVEALVAATPYHTPNAQPPDSKPSPILPIHKRAKLVRLSNVVSRPVNWLWRNRIALGKVTLFAGDPGLGKSFTTIDMTSRITTGTPWPDAPHDPISIGGVVILTAEDDLEDTVKPRLDAAGANTELVNAIESIIIRDEQNGVESDRMFDVTRDIEALEGAIDATPECKLVIIDPITAYLGKTDSHKNAEVRAVLAMLSDLARRKGVAVVCVTHLRKGEGPAIYRSMGSLAFVAAARAVWGVVKDKDDATGKRRLFLCVKNNNAPDQSGLAFELRSMHGDTPPTIAWDSRPVTTTADDAMTFKPRKPGPAADDLKQAEALLRSALAKGPRAAADLLDEATGGSGISKRTLDRAKKSLKVIAFRPTNPGPWHWRLPNPSDEPAHAGEPRIIKPPEFGHVPELGDLGNLGIVPDFTQESDAANGHVEHIAKLAESQGDDRWDEV